MERSCTRIFLHKKWTKSFLREAFSYWFPICLVYFSYPKRVNLFNQVYPTLILLHMYIQHRWYDFLLLCRKCGSTSLFLLACTYFVVFPDLLSSNCKTNWLNVKNSRIIPACVGEEYYCDHYLLFQLGRRGKFTQDIKWCDIFYRILQNVIKKRDFLI